MRDHTTYPLTFLTCICTIGNTSVEFAVITMIPPKQNISFVSQTDISRSILPVKKWGPALRQHLHQCLLSIAKRPSERNMLERYIGRAKHTSCKKCDIYVAHICLPDFETKLGLFHSTSTPSLYNSDKNVKREPVFAQTKLKTTSLIWRRAGRSWRNNRQSKNPISNRLNERRHDDVHILLETTRPSVASWPGLDLFLTEIQTEVL